ncbi:MAG: hypothetical protein J6S67_15560 [Methanobrevibacter sp.]|nr:hypothetical protein [Methanobrevibacter sp.]
MNVYDLLMGKCICGGDKDERITLNATHSGEFYAPPGKVFDKVIVDVPTGGENMIVDLEYDNNINAFVMNKRFSEIFNYLKNGTPCYLRYGLDPEEGNGIDDEYRTFWRLMPISHIFKYENAYRIYVVDGRSSAISNLSNTVAVPAVLVFSASVSSDYPVYLNTIYVNGGYCTYDSYIDFY